MWIELVTTASVHALPAASMTTTAPPATTPATYICKTMHVWPHALIRNFSRTTYAPVVSPRAGCAITQPPHAHPASPIVACSYGTTTSAFPKHNAKSNIMSIMSMDHVIAALLSARYALPWLIAHSVWVDTSYSEVDASLPAPTPPTATLVITSVGHALAVPLARPVPSALLAWQFSTCTLGCATMHVLLACILLHRYCLIPQSEAYVRYVLLHALLVLI